MTSSQHTLLQPDLKIPTQNPQTQAPKKASLTQVIIIWVKMTLGLGLFNNPKQLSALGLYQGCFYFVLAALLTFYTFQVLFEAVNYTKKDTYIEVVENLLGKNFKKITNFTLIIDYSCSLIFYAIAAWDLFQIIL